MNVLLVIGSRNTKGRTARAAEAAMDGLKSKGAGGKAIFLTQLRIERCRQCEDSGWGICRSEGRCIIEDDFASVVEQLRSADAAVFATPVYFADLSESTRAFLDRLRRITRNDAGKVGLTGKSTLGICMAGGGGGAAPECAVSLDRVLGTCGLDVVDIVLVRRQNLDLKLDVLKTTGAWLASCPSSQRT